MTDIVQPSTLPGFMELLPEDQRVFNRMKDIIRKNYEEKGFLPIDTPVLEKQEVLLAKGGGETEKQIYAFKKGNTDLAMRFDLTVPLARYVAQHYSDLSFPFRRYHIGKVYRGERAQKGRFREFYQCDIDIIGNGKLSLFNDGEIPSIIESTFMDLGFSDFTIHINNRKILNGFYRSLGIDDSTEVLRIVDKLDKIGLEAVKEELQALGLSDASVSAIADFIAIDGTTQEVFEALRALPVEEAEFSEGVAELEAVFDIAYALGVKKEHIKPDMKIARGLDYYTGTVYETILDKYPSIGSVCSGGRYDNLAAHYTKQSLPGVGISIGLSRLYYQLNEAGLLDDFTDSALDVLILPFEETKRESLALLKTLRDAGICAGYYGESGKMGKKFKYADQLRVPYCIVVGLSEIESGAVTLRDMENGKEERLSPDALVEYLRDKKRD
ncbi:Histidine--tRNA ligase [Aedoeadaptatus ivorii]|uniref:Histidine--tRNA ligase n=1 Tax=Aedoeadaptatus ivorii TaxID=54006 RepID=A0A3S5BW91_9FIRM|nr:histidine--tRNA ligase [Peptoniphilus ivorii]MDQ0508912.1 histidyl-tRNA synthetase [Peptoniphilus ivorii]VEJ35738.1 Histidine--tRNA ligase [Peptoniphilus ivorii]